MRLGLPLRLLWRDSRAGELTILFLALLIAVTSSTTIALFSSRLERTMTEQTAEFLAADMVISSHATVPDAWLKKATEMGLVQAQTAEFTSVLMEHDEILLASIKSVSDKYPLRGFLKTTTTDFAGETVDHQGPAPGFAWAEMRVFTALNLKVGDSITVGEKKLSLAKVLTYEPDKQGDLYSLSPRLIMNKQDLPETGIIQPGSHVHYFFQFSGDSAQLANYKAWLKPLLNPAQRLLDIHEDRPELGTALNRAERYLGLSSIIVIIISGVAIAMATRRYTERHLDATAILRCLGTQQNAVLWLFVSQFLILGLFTSGLGCGLGWFAQEMLFNLLRDLLPQSVAKPGWLAVFFGMITGMTTLFGFALPPLLRLKRVSPARVLRRDLVPLPVSAWLTYGLSAGIVGIFIWQYTEDLYLTATVFGSGFVLMLVLIAGVYSLLLLARRTLPRMGLSWRFGFQGLLRNRSATVSQILAFTITLVAMALSFTVRNDLIENWHKQLPEHAPNHFALNIFPEQLPDIQRSFQENGIESSQIFPVVRGRLTEINGMPVQKRVSKDSQGENATHRELNLTWSEQLPQDNQIISGNWWSSDTKGQVSIEQKLAESLNIKLGDQLVFVIGGQNLPATVSSVRTLQWDTMKPNFYIIFSPGTLDGFPRTYLTSFYLDDAKKTVLNHLLKRFPAMTILEVDLLLKQFKTILAQLTQALTYLLYFALMAGFTVLLSAIYSTLDLRIYESALLRTFGAKRSLLTQTHVIEFGVLGFVAGLLAIGITEALLYALYSRALHIDYHPTWYLWLALPLIGTFSVGWVGCWGVRHVARTEPLKVLRNN